MRGHGDRVLGIVLGIVLGLAVVIVFVFLGSGGTIDAPSLSGNDDSTQQAPAQRPAQGEATQPKP
jgi:hypothetical protein